MKTWTSASCVALVAAIAAACGGGAANAPAQSAPSRAAGQAALGACHPLAAPSVRAVGAPSGSSTVLLASSAGKTLAYVSDEDVHAVLTVDLDAKKQLASTPIDGTPGQMLLTRDGRLLVALRDRASVLALVPPAAPEQPLAAACAAPTAVEPFAMALTPDGASVLVSHAWGRSLVTLDAGTLAKKSELPLPREPRAVAVSDDGKTAFVSHAVGSRLSVVDLTKGSAKALTLRGKDPMLAMRRRVQRATPARMKAAGVPMSPEMERRFADLAKQAEEEEETGRVSCQGYALAKSYDPAGRVLLPQVFVDGGDPNQRAEGYGDDDTPTEAPNVAVLDETTGAPLDTSLAFQRERMFMGGADDPRDHHEPCLLPRAAAVDPASKSLLVTCFGIDDVVAYDAAAASPVRAEKRRWGVGAGPTGIAVDPAARRAIVWSQFDRVLDVVDLAGAPLASEGSLPRERSARIELPDAPRKISAEVALGRLLFHAAGDNRIAKDGRACASCHPDGRDDAITWATPDGPRRSIFLAGRVGTTPPYSWSNGEKTLRDHLATTFDRLDGTGLRSVELDAIVAYVTSMAPPNAAAAQASARDAKVARGKEIFDSPQAACASCHVPGADFTDGQLHDVKSKTPTDKSAQFNTPSLRGVGGTGPWFHDGRYKTLRELLRGVDGKMGNTKQLADADVDALEAYLRTL